ncbi:MAG: addiction module antitoxin [Chloroflexi bacterium CG07_land_8_20_14_0_80_51_10]|nr:MAG: addiction module antitoxin [Chloroflexi bacterium CG07_land_8_20_14_0_80_51_10]
MQKKLTITVDEKVYDGLHKRIGQRCISHFIEDLVRPHVIDKELDLAYAQMAKDEQRETEASEWIEGVIGDASDESR